MTWGPNLDDRATVPVLVVLVADLGVAAIDVVEPVADRQLGVVLGNDAVPHLDARVLLQPILRNDVVVRC